MKLYDNTTTNKTNKINNKILEKCGYTRMLKILYKWFIRQRKIYQF